MRRWLAEAFVRAPRSLDPLLDAGRRYVMPVLRGTLPAARLVGETATGETARVLVIDRRYAANRLCRLLFTGEPAVEWSGRCRLPGCVGSCCASEAASTLCWRPFRTFCRLSCGRRTGSPCLGWSS